MLNYERMSDRQQQCYDRLKQANGSIDLSENRIGDSEIQAVTAATQANAEILQLRLSRNRISEIGAQQLAALFKNTATLTRIDLDSNQIGDAGARQLASALKSNLTITWLDLSHNHVGNAGAKGLANMLKSNSTLTHLLLASNQVGDPGAQAIGHALGTNSRLQVLQLGNNPIGEIGKQAFTLSGNKTCLIRGLDGLLVEDLPETAAFVGQPIALPQDNADSNLELQQLKQDFRLLQSQLSNSNALLQHLQNSNALLQSQILTSTHEFKQLQETHALVHAQLLNSVSNVEFQQLQEANKSLETQLASKLVDIDAARLRLMQAGESIRATQSRHAQLQQVSSQALSDSAQKQRQLEAQVQQLQAQLLSATQEMATKEAELEAVRVELFAAQLAGRPGTQPAQSVSAAAFAEMEAAEAEAAANRVETPQLPMHFVLELTGNFTPLACLGSGRTGAYYQCMMGDQLVAVKRLLPQESADPTQFRSEIELLARLSHPNVVPLYFYAEEGSDRCMVFEHMKHGSVRDRLSLKNNTPPLSWQQRHAIAVGVAEAMRFVQQAIPRSPVFHLNLKSSNVLLDNHFVAKITDFGLSRSPPVASSKHIFRQGIQHSMQYLCPEYRDEGKVSLKTDVFSFGMLLFELLTGQEPSLNLRGNARREIRRNQHARATFDTTIAWSEASTAQAEQVCNLAIDCMEEARMYRPSFTDALEILGVAVPGPPPAADENDGARERECLICLSAPTTAKLMPCRHACLCTECATTLMQRNERCPVCRGHIESFETGNFLQTFVAQRS